MFISRWLVKYVRGMEDCVAIKKNKELLRVCHEKNRSLQYVIKWQARCIYVLVHV